MNATRSNRLWAGILVLAAAALAGCSTNNGSDATAAIAGTAAPAAIAAAPLIPALPPVNSATCEQVKAELATLGADKIPQKLAQFGQSKYTPTADETARFTRYVELNQASKSRCVTAAATQKKQKTAAATSTTKTVKVTKTAKAPTATTKTASATATKAVTQKAKQATAAATTTTGGVAPLIGTAPAAPAESAVEGVTTTIIPD